jgi:hypothetical protein
MNKRTIDTIMDLRDERIRLGYKVAFLADKELWEPHRFTEDDAFWLRYYRAEIARIKAAEEELHRRITN